MCVGGGGEEKRGGEERRVKGNGNTRDRRGIDNQGEGEEKMRKTE